MIDIVLAVLAYLVGFDALQAAGIQDKTSFLVFFAIFLTQASRVFYGSGYGAGYKAAKQQQQQQQQEDDTHSGVA